MKQKEKPTRGNKTAGNLYLCRITPTLCPDRTLKRMERNDWLFWFGCLPTRALLAYAAKDIVPSLPKDDQVYVQLLAAVPAVLWLSGTFEDRDVGFFGGDAYWRAFRKLHGLSYAVYAVTLDYRSLVFDLLLAVVAWLDKKNIIDV